MKNLNYSRVSGSLGNWGFLASPYILIMLCLSGVLAQLSSHLYELPNHTHSELKYWDQIILEWAHRQHTPFLNDVALNLTSLGSGVLLIPVVVIIAVSFILFENRIAALQLVTASLGASLLSSALKVIFQRPRPDILDPVFSHLPSGGFSYPSGHSMGGAAVIFTLALLASHALKEKRKKSFVLISSLILIFCVGASRIYLGVHYPSDAFGGVCFGMLWALIVDQIVFRKEKVKNLA